MFAVFRDLIRYNIEFAIGLVLFTVVVIYACLSFFSPVDPTMLYIEFPDSRPMRNTGSAPIAGARTCSGN